MNNLAIKLVKLIRKLYLASIALALKLENKRDRVAIKRYHAEIKAIDALQERANRILASIQSREDDANRRIGELQAEIIAQTNELQNLRDGV